MGTQAGDDGESIRFPTPFRIIAHRGASARAPENTLPAFERALALGAVEVELDVRRSRDGVLFLFHDENLDEKTNASGPFAERSAAELRRVDIGSWFDREQPQPGERFAGTGLITLRELFARFGEQLFYHVEIKGEEVEISRQVADLVREFGLERRVMVTSFSLDQLLRVRAVAPELPICWLLPRRKELERALSPARAATTIFELQQPLIERARDEGFAQVGIAASDVSAEAVRFGHAQGLEVRGWGVENDAHADKLIDAGANGMTTNWPERLIEQLERHRALEAPG